MSEEDYLLAAPNDNTVMLESFKWAMSTRSEDMLIRNLNLDLTSGTLDGELISEKRVSPINIYTERLLACLVSLVQPELADKKLNREMIIKPSERLKRGGFTDVMVPIKLLLSSTDDQNYSYAVKAAANLQSILITIKYEDGIKLRNMITATDANFKDGYLLFSVSEEVWQLLLDFSKGFRKTEFWVVRKLRKAVSYRFYKLIAGQKSSLTYKIDELASSFNIPKSSYFRPSVFEAKVLEPVKNELDAVSPWSFEYEFAQSAEMAIFSHRGRKTNDLVILKPKHLLCNERKTEYLKDEVPGHCMSSLLDTNVKKLLKEHYGLSEKEINSWSELLADADRLLPGGLLRFLVDKDRQLKDASVRNRKGYLHNALQNEVEKQRAR